MASPALQSLSMYGSKVCPAQSLPDPAKGRAASQRSAKGALRRSQLRAYWRRPSAAVQYAVELRSTGSVGLTACSMIGDCEFRTKRPRSIGAKSRGVGFGRNLALRPFLFPPRQSEQELSSCGSVDRWSRIRLCALPPLRHRNQERLLSIIPGSFRRRR
jgi:hypothetical protein